MTNELVPTCPKCQGSMQLRTARFGANAGGKFWGCNNYPHCKGTRNAESEATDVNSQQNKSLNNLSLFNISSRSRSIYLHSYFCNLTIQVKEGTSITRDGLSYISNLSNDKQRVLSQWTTEWPKGLNSFSLN